MNTSVVSDRWLNEESGYWKDKRVVLVQHNATFNPRDTSHPLMCLHALGARITVVARPSTSTLETLRSHEAIDEILLFTHTSIVRTLLACFREPRHDVALLCLPYLTFEKYIPHIACFIFLRALTRKVLIRNGTVYEEYTLGRFLKECVRRLWPYATIIASIPYIALHNTLRNKRIVPSDIKRILFVRTDHIGDVIMATPLLAMMHEQFPHATIDMLLGPWSAELFEHDPRVRKVIRFVAPWHDRGVPIQDPFVFLRKTQTLFRLLRREKYDIALDSRGNFLDSWVAYRSGAPIVAGSVGFFYNMAVISNSPFLTHQTLYGDTLHYAGEQHRRLAQTLSRETIEPKSTALFPAKEACATIESLLATTPPESILVSLHMSCGDESRRWPIEKFMELVKRLHARYGDTVWFFLIGGASDGKENEVFSHELHNTGITQVNNVAGKLSLPETAALLARMCVHIGNDSGPMHIADAVGTPVVALFIRMLACVHAPIRPHHAIVMTKDDTSPIATIEVQEVYTAVCGVVTEQRK